MYKPEKTTYDPQFSVSPGLRNIGLHSPSSVSSILQGWKDTPFQVAKATLFRVANLSKWTWNQKDPQFQSYQDSWSPHPIIACYHPDLRGDCTCGSFPWFRLAYTLHTSHPTMAFKVACPLDPCCILLGTVCCRLSSIPLCSNNRRNCHLRIYTGVSSSRRHSWIPPDSCPNQDSPTPVLRASLPFVDISLVTYH